MIGIKISWDRRNSPWLLKSITDWALPLHIEKVSCIRIYQVCFNNIFAFGGLSSSFLAIRSRWRIILFLGLILGRLLRERMISVRQGSLPFADHSVNRLTSIPIPGSLSVPTATLAVIKIRWIYLRFDTGCIRLEPTMKHGRSLIHLCVVSITAIASKRVLSCVISGPLPVIALRYPVLLQNFAHIISFVRVVTVFATLLVGPCVAAIVIRVWLLLTVVHQH